jgi:Transaldolase/Fructose-6-phosphate aldolase
VTAQRQAQADESFATNSLRRLHDVGQGVWLDFLARRFIAEGGLKKLVEQDGLTGVTSNPSTFEKAIAGSADYDSRAPRTMTILGRIDRRCVATVILAHNLS